MSHSPGSSSSDYRRERAHRHGNDISPITPPDHPLGGLHTLDESSYKALSSMLEDVQRRRLKSESNLPKPSNSTSTLPKKPSKLKLSFLSRRSAQSQAKAQQQKEQQQQQMNIENNINETQVREENCKLKERLSKLEMDQVELSSLRNKVVELEWALDAVREDADRVRDDALALLSGLENGEGTL